MESFFKKYFLPPIDFIEDFSKKSRPTFAKWLKLLNKEGVDVVNFMPKGREGDTPSSIEDFSKNSTPTFAK